MCLFSARFTFVPLLFALVPLALGQSSIGSSDERLASKYFDEPALSAPSLNCRVKPVEPFLDFAFRFEAGYLVRCPIREFEGKESTVLVFLRITPEGQSPVLLGDQLSCECGQL